MPDEACAVETAVRIGAAAINEVAAVALVHLPHITSRRSGIQPVVEGGAEVVIGLGVAVEEVYPLRAGLVVAVAACDIECLAEKYPVGVIENCCLCTETAVGKEAAGKDHN